MEYNGQCLEITHLIDLLSADNFTVSSGNLASVELPVIAVLSVVQGCGGTHTVGKFSLSTIVTIPMYHGPLTNKS